MVNSGDSLELSQPSEMTTCPDPDAVTVKDCTVDVDCSPSDDISASLKTALDSALTTYESIGYSESEKETKRQAFVDKIEQTIRSFALTAQQEKSALINECFWLNQQIYMFLEHIEDPEGARLSETDRRLLSINPSTTLSNSSITLLELKKGLHSVFLIVLKWFTEALTELGNLLIEYFEVASVVDMRFESPGLCCFSPDEADKYFEILKEFDVLYKEATSLPVSDVIIALPSQNNDSVSHAQSPTDTKCSVGTDTIDAQFRGVNYKLVQLVQGMDVRISKTLLSDIETETTMVRSCSEQRERDIRIAASECSKMISELELVEQEVMLIQKESADELKMKDVEFVEQTYTIADINTFKENPRQFGLHKKHINSIKSWRSKLDAITKTLTAEVEEEKMKCFLLWDKLDVDLDYQYNFSFTWKGFLKRTLAEWRNEHSRLIVLRSQHVEKYISSLQLSIQKLWSDLHYGPERRQQWEYVDWNMENGSSRSSAVDMEKVLDDHEAYLEKLKEEYDRKAHILLEYEKFLALLSLKQQLIDSSKDPSRLTGSDAVSIGLQEARKHKEFAQKFPRVTEELKRRLAEEDEPFLVDDEPLLTIIEAAENQHCRARSPTRTPQRLSPRKNPVGARNTQPRRDLSSPTRRNNLNTIPRDPSPVRRHASWEMKSPSRSPTAIQPGTKLQSSPIRSPRSRNLKPPLPQEARRTPSLPHVFDMRPTSPTKLPTLRRPLQSVGAERKRPLLPITNKPRDYLKKPRNEELNDSFSNGTFRP